MTNYQVDETQMENYIKSLDKHRIIIFIVAILVVLSLQAFIMYNLDSNFPFWVFI
jgi:cytochrome c-type biogenesis protein CcmE